MSSELSEVLAKPEELSWGGETIVCEPFSLNDLADLEYHISDLGLLDVSRFEHQRLLLWLVFRRLDKRLTAADIDNLRYQMTPAEAGKLVTARDYQENKVQPFLEAVLRLSGLAPEKPAEGNEEAAPTARKPAKRTATAPKTSPLPE